METQFTLENLEMYAELSHLDKQIVERCKWYETPKMWGYRDWRFNARSKAISISFEHYYIDIPIWIFIANDERAKAERYMVIRHLEGVEKHDRYLQRLRLKRKLQGK